MQENNDKELALRPHPHLTKWRSDCTRALEALGVMATLLLIFSISMEAFSGRVFSENSIYTKIQIWVCFYFLFALIVQILFAPKKIIFALKNTLLILLSIPYLSLIHKYSINLSNEAIYLIKFLPILRGGIALIVIVKMLASNPITGLFLAYLVSFFSIIYFQTLIFFVFESPQNIMVNNYFDALWWAAMTVTTIGSSILPITAIGKFCTTLVAIIGMTTFPIFTVYISSLIQNINKGKL